MRARLAVAGLVALALLAAPSAAGAQGARGKAGGRAAHPRVGADQDCEACHAQATPAAFEAWSAGKHGLALVKCVVCHGSTGADFRRRPAADRCEGCHATRVASLKTPAMKGKDCFTCHAGHALDPHATARASSAAARLGADALPPMQFVEGKIPPPPPPAP